MLLRIKMQEGNKYARKCAYVWKSTLLDHFNEIKNHVNVYPVSVDSSHLSNNNTIDKLNIVEWNKNNNNDNDNDNNWFETVYII